MVCTYILAPRAHVATRNSVADAGVAQFSPNIVSNVINCANQFAGAYRRVSCGAAWMGDRGVGDGAS